MSFMSVGWLTLGWQDLSEVILVASVLQRINLEISYSVPNHLSGISPKVTISCSFSCPSIPPFFFTPILSRYPCSAPQQQHQQHQQTKHAPNSYFTMAKKFKQKRP